MTISFNTLFGQRDVRETATGTKTLAPIGSIMPWLKSFTNTPVLPVGWVECDGTVLSDAESVYDGQTLPDLNGDNQFPRGNSTSGGTGGSSTHTLTEAEMPAHTHTVPLQNSVLGTATEIPAAAGINFVANRTTSTTGSGNAHENKPPFYDVVWIMRVK